MAFAPSGLFQPLSLTAAPLRSAAPPVDRPRGASRPSGDPGFLQDHYTALTPDLAQELRRMLGRATARWLGDKP